MSGTSSRYILYAAEEGEVTNRPTIYEATQYHDLLDEMTQSDWMKQVSHDTRIAILVMRDSLCWSLGHDNNGNFGGNLGDWAEEFKEYEDKHDTFDN